MISINSLYSYYLNQNVTFRYAKEFRKARLFLGSGSWGRNKTLVVFSERTLLPWVMGQGDFIVGNRKVGKFYFHIYSKIKMPI